MWLRKIVSNKWVQHNNVNKCIDSLLSLLFRVISIYTIKCKYKEWFIFCCGTCRLNVHDRADKYTIMRARDFAVFSCRLCVLRAFPFISLINVSYWDSHAVWPCDLLNVIHVFRKPTTIWFLMLISNFLATRKHMLSKTRPDRRGVPLRDLLIWAIHKCYRRKRIIITHSFLTDVVGQLK